MPDQGTHPPPVPAAEYIDAIAQHVSSVCVITTVHDGQRYGLTATAVSSVCAAPPRLLVCVNKSGLTHDKIVAAGRFAVNVLTEEQEQVAMVFAGMGDKSAFESFERMQERIESNERKAIAAAELQEEFTGDKLTREFEQLEYHGSSDQQLLELKQKMGLLGGGTTEAPKQIKGGATDADAEAEVIEENDQA